MKTSTALLLCILITAASLAYAFAVYPSLPNIIPTHWNAAGKIDGYGPKSTLYLLPCLPLLAVVLLLVLPPLSPKNFTIDTFRSTFNYIMVIVAAMMGYLSFVIIYGTKNAGWDFTKPLIAGLMLFTGLMGNFMGKVQKNFYMGFRTPWTLASDTVWVATHRLAARLMTPAGIVGALCVWGGVPPIICFAVFVLAVLYPAVYSLILYKKLEKTGQLT